MIIKNDPSLDESLSVPFKVQYVNRNLQVDWIFRCKDTKRF